MRKEFNDKNCKNMHLGMEYTQIPDSDISASSELPSSPAHHARLGYPGGWCGDQDNSDPLYLQVDLTKAYIICAIATQGHFKVNMGFVEKYRLQYSEDRIAWTFYRPPSGSEVCYLEYHNIFFRWRSFIDTDANTRRSRKYNDGQLNKK